MTIKPCPFCKSTKITYAANTVHNYRNEVKKHIYMYCEKCRCHGPRTLITLEGEERRHAHDDKYINIAITAWNNR